MIVGGVYPTPLKKLNGARFGRPSLSTVLTQPIGRGTMHAENGLNGKPWSSFDGS
jgi:hypothetical protein